MTFLTNRSWGVLFSIVLTVLFPAIGYGQNPIQIENAQPGTSGWELSNPATNREIEGYGSLTSVNVGGQINLFVSTRDSSFKLEVFRTGWYGGVGARRLMTVNSVAGRLQTTPNPDPVTGLIECRWTNPYTLSVPANWVSGIYLARLTGNQSTKQSYIIFVVRDDGRASDLLFESSVTTFQAYNFWPGGANGKSLYDWAPGGRAWKVSFNRPYVLGNSYTSSTPGAASGLGAGEYLANLQPGPATGYPIPAAGFEYNMVRWLEKNGYDVTYMTDMDLHENPNLLDNHRAFLSVGHNEYWSMQMRQNVEEALASGVNLGIFSSNTLYWQVRFEPASNGAADRTMVCYKYDAAAHDPLFSSNPQFATVEWRQPPVDMPEAALLGSEYVGDPVESDIVISNASHWLMNGTGLHNGDHLRGILGYEVDVMVPGVSPPNTEILASSPFGPLPADVDNPPGFSCGTQTCNANVTWYSAGRAFVFATGSLQWSWGLDDYNAPSLRSAFSSTAAQKLTANVLASFISPVAVATTSLPSGTRGSVYPNFQLSATGGGQPYSWTAAGLPAGMTLSTSGVLGGTPSVSGTFPVAFTVTDAAAHQGSATLNLVISGGGTTFAISGQITLSGSGLSGVSVSLSTGAGTTTNSSGNYSFTGLAGGTSYTVTPALSGYQFTPPSQTFNNLGANQTANFTASVVSSTARAVSINFVGNGTLMGTSESAGVVAKTNWNNATGNTNSSMALKDETGAGNGATLSYTGDNPWAVPITDTAGNFRMMRGYLDTGNQNPSTITISGLPFSTTGYDIYVYIDGDNETSTVTGTYTISGTGITAASIKATDPGNANFNGTFTQASNSNGNYIKFTAVQATAFTLKATPTTASDGVLRAPVNGIQIIPSPQQSTTARVVSINFVGNGTLMGTSESAGVVAKTNWNNATGNTNSSMALKDETGAGNGATLSYTGDNPWAVPITDTAGNFRMMRGYLDTGNQNPSTITISGLPFSTTGYDIYVYIDGDNETSTVTGTYTISGTGITAASIKATDPGNANFNGTFTQASNSNGNYIKFTAVQATAFTLKATPTTASNGVLRAPVNGIQIVPSPQTSTPRTVSIDFVGTGTSMGASESAGVVAKTNWNNAPGNASSSLALVDETGTANGASVSYSADNTWGLPITDTAGNARMMRGYLDNGSGNPSTITVSGLPVSSTGYDIYVYADGDNGSGTVTRTYTLTGAGITTTSITATDPPNTNFGGGFTQANNSNGNYVKFTGVQATVFTITATPTSASGAGLRAPVNGLQIVPH
jgi:hypothetical protein